MTVLRDSAAMTETSTRVDTAWCRRCLRVIPTETRHGQQVFTGHADKGGGGLLCWASHQPVHLHQVERQRPL